MFTFQTFEVDLIVDRVGIDGGLVAVLVDALCVDEVGGQCAAIRSSEGIGHGFANYDAVFCPVLEEVVVIRFHSKRDLIALMVNAFSGDIGGISRIDVDLDVDRLSLEVSHKVAVGVHDKTIGGICGDGSAVLSPVDEDIALGGRCNDRAVLAIGVGPTASDGATIVRVR